MARPAVRIQTIQVLMLLALLGLVGRAAQVQLVQGKGWADEARASRTERIVLGARRGTLSDRHGTPIARTLETYHVGVAPNELRDPRRDGAAIAEALRLSPVQWQQALHKRYAYFGGPYSAITVDPIRAIRGVHLEPVLNRFYPSAALARGGIGGAGGDGARPSRPGRAPARPPAGPA